MLGDLEDNGESDKASIDNTNKGTIETIEESDSGINIRLWAGIITESACAWAYISVVVKGMIRTYFLIALMDIVDQTDIVISTKLECNN